MSLDSRCCIMLFRCYKRIMSLWFVIDLRLARFYKDAHGLLFSDPEVQQLGRLWRDLNAMSNFMDTLRTHPEQVSGQCCSLQKHSCLSKQTQTLPGWSVTLKLRKSCPWKNIRQHWLVVLIHFLLLLAMSYFVGLIVRKIDVSYHELGT